MEQLSKLSVSMGDEMRAQDEVKVSVVARLLMVMGDLLEYNPLEDNYIVRAKEVFVSIDKTGDYKYMLNVVDKEQKTSYTRKEL